MKALDRFLKAMFAPLMTVQHLHQWVRQHAQAERADGA
jgi:hypothetical protein